MVHADLRDAAHRSYTLGSVVSLLAHALLFGVLLFYRATFAPGSGPPATTAIARFDLEAFNRSARGGGVPGGSGPTAPARPPETRSSPAPNIAASTTPVDVAAPPPISVAIATPDAVRTIPGGTVQIDTTAVGQGPALGAGSGRGPGNGPGLGSGRESGAGGDAYDVGNGVTAPQLIQEVKPAYTATAMRAKVQGLVELEVVVLPDGSVDPHRIRIIRSLDSAFGLDEQAVLAVKQWRFRPGTRLNEPAPVRVRVELTFTLR